jgi:hypothetical protein
MRRNLVSLLLSCATSMSIVCAAAPGRAATLVTSRAALGASDAADWGSLRQPSNTSVGNPFTLGTTNGHGISVSKPVAGSGGFTFFIQASANDGFPPYWGGNFAPLDNLLNTSLNDPGPIKISFKEPVSGAGAQIETNGGGTFGARITSFDSNGLQLSSFTEKGIATGAKDGSAIFLGILDETTDISAVQFSIDIFPPFGPGQFTDFSINQLGIATTAVPGDYTRDGSVDAADYVIWRKGLGTTYTQADYNVWRANFGQSGGSGAGASSPSKAAVPEPSSIALLATILAAMTNNRAALSRQIPNCQ